ncbi:MAG: UDP-2,3-diacylglucosamine diphosphatase [Candidatus Krumholzibacteriia bacterium]
MSNRIAPTVLFVADSHFHLRPDAAERHRLERFLAFLQFSRRATDLVLLGDIFDFWFDYPHFRLDGYEEVLQALDAVRAAGTRLHFVGGNHDIWAAAYFRRRYGATGDGEAVTREFGALRVRLDHGDGFLARGLVYRAFRALVRRRGTVLVAKALHPELLYAFSTWLSGTSRLASRDEVALIERRARERLLASAHAPWDLLVIGHVHHPYVTTHTGRTLACLPGWLQTEGYGLLRDGRFDLLDFARDPLPDLPPDDHAPGV